MVIFQLYFRAIVKPNIMTITICVLFYSINHILSLQDLVFTLFSCTTEAELPQRHVPITVGHIT